MLTAVVMRQGTGKIPAPLEYGLMIDTKVANLVAKGQVAGEAPVMMLEDIWPRDWPTWLVGMDAGPFAVVDEMREASEYLRPISLVQSHLQGRLTPEELLEALNIDPSYTEPVTDEMLATAMED